MIKTKYTAYMNTNRHKLLTVAAGLSALLLAAACSADAVDAPVASGGGSTAVAGGKAVTFSVSGDGSLTRTAQGTIADIGGLRSSGFGVFACHHGSHPYESSSVSANFMWNQLVTWDDSHGVWTYEPVKYWPQGDGDDEHLQYLSFFAYAPYSEAGGTGCVTDFSNNTDTGDPWLVYQLGGTRDSWKSAQKDLLYSFCKDQQQTRVDGNSTTSRISLGFRHALAAAGDRISVTVSSDLQAKLKEQAAASGHAVSLFLDGLVLNYTLVRKGRLVLNSSYRPNWQQIESEDPMTHRVLTLTPPANTVIATAADGSSCTADGYTFHNQGIFYIPMEVLGQEQTVDITARYHTSEGYLANVASTVKLDVEDRDGRSQDFNLCLFKLPVGASEDISVGMRILDIADQTYSGIPLMPPVTVVSSDGRVLTEGTDYTLTYSGNVNVPLPTDDPPSANAVGIGDYQGKMAKKLFAIRQATGTLSFPELVQTLSVGGTLSAAGKLSHSGDGTVSYSSSDTGVANVDAGTGVVTAVAAGNCVIFATVSDGRNYTYPVRTVSFYLTVR